jgi:hypothetical protein
LGRGGIGGGEEWRTVVPVSRIGEVEQDDGHRVKARVQEESKAKLQCK